MKVIRLPRLRRLQQAAPESTSAAPLEQGEQRAHPSLDELLVPYSVYVSRWSAGTGNGGRQNADLDEPLAESLAAPGADASADAMAVHPRHHDAAIGHSSDDAGMEWDDDDAVSGGRPGEHEDRLDPETDAGYPDHAPDARPEDEEARAHTAEVPSPNGMLSNPAPTTADSPEPHVPHAPLHGLAEAVRLAGLDDAALLAEAGLRRIEGRRAMTREELTAALLAIHESELDVAA